MWDTAQTNGVHLSHDMPCPRCGHDLHTLLVCDTRCACEPIVMPGAEAASPTSPTSGLYEAAGLPVAVNTPRCAVLPRDRRFPRGWDRSMVGTWPKQTRPQPSRTS